ncbi:hypothetical protein AAY42_16965 [Flagellimonas eckloniae]|uniref:Uncharacterized protein n=1 Tax=Flagellimonas eckloniae TaxID=346185 RepID=A0A0Q0X1A7_9FLAO|nr:hypothetical protein AAY42_16965 [Allomuricauda eckloniae]
MVHEFLEFLKEQYFIPFYFVTWVISALNYRKYFDTVLKYFPVFIAYTFFTEVLGYFIKFHDGFQFFSDERYSWDNVIIYNVYSIVSFSFFYYIYLNTLKNQKHKKWLKYGILVSAIGYLVSIFVQDPFHINLYYADLIASIVLLFAIGLYIKEKMGEPSDHPMKFNLLFWISLGLVVFHIFFPFIFLLLYEAIDFYYKYHLHELLIILIMVMYCLFSIGFLMSKRKAFR